jgi:6-phosphogluconolactonase (cycloisomerase 2 family)
LSAIASAALLALASIPASAQLSGNSGVVPLATGLTITPQAVSGAVQQWLNPGLPGYPNFVAGEAVKSQLSPDHKTLAVLCAGQNSLVKTDGTVAGTAVDTANSTQYIFLYDISASPAQPVLKQVIQQPNAHVGLVFSPDGSTMYVTGGVDDAVYVYTQSGGSWAKSAKIALGHSGGLGLTTSPYAPGINLTVQPNASGLGISADGKTLVVANNYNDSISVIDTASRSVRYEHDLRPYFANNEGTSGVAGGTFPFGVVVKGNGTAYVSSDRDRQVIAIDISSPTAGHLLARIPLDGNALGMTLDAAQANLYVAQDNADEVAVINTASNTVSTRIDARAPAGMLGANLTGAATFAVTLSPDGSTLYAVNSGANDIAVIPLTGPNANTVAGLIPTAYEPHDITFSSDGSWMYIVNGKSATGPNSSNLYGNTSLVTSITYPGGNAAASAAAEASNQYQFQLESSSLVSAPVPTAASLSTLTMQVAKNNGYSATPVANDVAVMNFLHSKIQHVIYIVKENRTFDQILGDLGNGSNGSPSLTMFGKRITPNLHKLASSFVTLDNFLDPGDGSMDGWAWSLQGRVTNTETITQQINYAYVNRGLSYDSEGTNRNIPVNYANPTDRDNTAGGQGLYPLLSAGALGGTANLLAGSGNHSSSDAPYGKQQGYIFAAVLNAGGTVRNYGFLVNNVGALVPNPYPATVQIGPYSFDPNLKSNTDIYFRGFDQNYPDLWRFNEWNREFQQYVTNGNLPSLSMVRLAHDHTGSFSTALAGVNTPETQQADNDYAVGKLVAAVANSPYASNTLIFITEDDSQDGPDHIDSHRSTAYVAGPYVKQGAVVSTRYNQVSVLRTIEDILGTQHMNLNTAFQRPMADVFNIASPPTWSFSASASTILKTTTLSLSAAKDEIRFADGPDIQPWHNAAWWAAATTGMDFSKADHVPPAQFNRVLWAGLMGDKAYPEIINPSHSPTLAKDDDDDND